METKLLLPPLLGHCTCRSPQVSRYPLNRPSAAHPVLKPDPIFLVPLSSINSFPGIRSASVAGLVDIELEKQVGPAGTALSRAVLGCGLVYESR